MTRSFCLALSLWALTSVLHAGDWPHWRGPAYNGSTDEVDLPTQWSQTENLRWTADLPGPAAATPIICGEQVYISSTQPAKEQLLALCFERRTGKLQWQHEIEKGIRRDNRSTFAAPSPVTDGQVVVFFYSSGTLVAYDPAGKLRWQRNIQQDYGEFAFQWTFSATPLLYDGKLYVQVLQRDELARGHGRTDGPNEPYLLALDPKTGRELWKHVRSSAAVRESREAFSSPIPFEHEGRREILLAGGDDLTGHDPESGRELWRWGTWNPQRIPHWRLVPSPVAGGGVVLACAPKGSPIYAVKAGGSGQLTDSALAWVSRDARAVSTDVPTPAFYRGDFFVLSDVRRALSRVEAATGRVRWTVETPGRAKYEASPLAGDGKLYLVNFDGLVVVVDANDGKILHQIPMAAPRDGDAAGPVRASIAAAHGNLFIRTNEKLYCVGSAEE